jgi:hypothetical protein
MGPFWKGSLLSLFFGFSVLVFTAGLTWLISKFTKNSPTNPLLISYPIFIIWSSILFLATFFLIIYLLESQGLNTSYLASTAFLTVVFCSALWTTPQNLGISRNVLKVPTAKNENVVATFGSISLTSICLSAIPAILLKSPSNWMRIFIGPIYLEIFFAIGYFIFLAVLFKISLFSSTKDKPAAKN